MSFHNYKNKVYLLQKYFNMWKMGEKVIISETIILWLFQFCFVFL